MLMLSVSPVFFTHGCLTGPFKMLQGCIGASGIYERGDVGSGGIRCAVLLVGRILAVL
jgi:hypothetical protein